MEDQSASSSSSSTSSVLSSSTSLVQPDASATSVITPTVSSKQDVKKSQGVAKKTKKVVVKKTKEVVKKPEDVVIKRANDNGFIKERPKLAHSTVKQVEPKNEDKPPTASQREHLQRGPRVNYSEMDVPDDDHFLCE